MRAFRSVITVAVVFAVAGSASAQASWNLTGTWKGSFGTVLQLRQSGTAVTWFARAADKKSWAHDFTGAISGESIAGTFQDRPGYVVSNRGRISARIVGDCHFTITELSIEGGPTTSGGERFERTVCPPVAIATVANGCGGAGWKSVVRAQNYLGNTSVYKNSNLNPLAKSYAVNFADACNLHDAGYAGAVVHDKLRGGIRDFRRWSRRKVDDKFHADMRLLCRRQIPATATIALQNCMSTGGNLSVGAESRYNFVRRFGSLFFDADLSQPGTQRTGPRANN